MHVVPVLAFLLRRPVAVFLGDLRVELPLNLPIVMTVSSGARASLILSISEPFDSFGAGSIPLFMASSRSSASVIDASPLVLGASSLTAWALERMDRNSSTVQFLFSGIPFMLHAS